MATRRSARLLLRSSSLQEDNRDLANNATSKREMTAKANGKNGTLNSKRSHDMAMGSDLEESQNKRIKHDQDPTKESQSLVSMPYDIIVEIFELAEMCGAICLGLTCKQLYGFLKMRHPKPIELQQQFCPRCPRGEGEKINRKYHIGCTNLPYLLEDWFGPRYRMSAEKSEWEAGGRKVSFVAIKVYGKECSKSKVNSAESRLFRRRQDYQRSALRNTLTKGGKWVETERLLPNPFNMGNKWYPQALAAIRASLFRFDTLDGWKRFFEDYNVMEETKESFEDLFEDTIAEYLQAKRTGKFVLTNERRLWNRM